MKVRNTLVFTTVSRLSVCDRGGTHTLHKVEKELKSGMAAATEISVRVRVKVRVNHTVRWLE